MVEHSYLISGCAPLLYPAQLHYGLFYINGKEAIEIPKRICFAETWGTVVSNHFYEQETFPLPLVLDMVWLSIIERKFYSLVEKLPEGKMEVQFGQMDEESGEAIFEHIVVGMAPYGRVALWAHGFKKSVMIAWMQAEETDVEMKDFLPMNPSITLDENCDFYINQDLRVKENLEKNGLPPRGLFDNYMKQFTYRYLPLFEQWDKDEEIWQPYTEDEQDTKPELDYIEEALFDGTHDKLHDGGLLHYHEAGKPKKLAIKWHIKKSEYSAYLWFEDQEIRTIFDRFYGVHLDTKTDFMIRIDSEKNKYELALYRYGQKEPVVINESAYQLIVFKNKFECFRSENYNQPRGAWIW